MPRILAAIAALLVFAPAASAAPTFGPVEEVDPNLGTALREQVGMDASGNVFYGTWRLAGPEQHAVVLRRCAGGAPWGDDVVRGADPAFTRDLAVAPSGRAVVVWTEGGGSSETLWSSVRPATGVWGAAEPIADDVSGGTVDVAIDDAGNAAVTWSDWSDGTTMASYRPAAGSWETPAELDGELGGALVAMGPGGQATFVGAHFQPGDDELRAVVRGPTGPGVAEPIVELDGTLSGLDVEYGGTGNPVVVFSDGGRRTLWTTTRTTSWSTPAKVDEELDSAGGIDLRDLAPHPLGAIVAWTRDDDFASPDADLWVQILGGAAPKRQYDDAHYSNATVAADSAGQAVVAATRHTGSVLEVWGAAVPDGATPWPVIERYSPAGGVGLNFRDPVAAGGSGLVIAWTRQSAGPPLTARSQARTTLASCGSSSPPPNNPSPPPPGNAGSNPPPTVLPKFGAYLKLPKAASCVKKRKLRLTVSKSLRKDVKSVAVKVNGKKRKLEKGLRLTGLPKKGSYKVEVTLRLKDGRVLKGSRRYRACA